MRKYVQNRANKKRHYGFNVTIVPFLYVFYAKLRVAELSGLTFTLSHLH